MCEICSKLTKTPKRRHRYSGVFNRFHMLCSCVSIVDFEQVNAGLVTVI